MNKKGFTLIEVLASISIIGLMTTITSISFTKMLDKEKNNSETNKETIITTAACTYIELRENKELKETCLKSGCEIDFEILKQEGLLDADDITEKKIIYIYKEDNQKKCILK